MPRVAHRCVSLRVSGLFAFGVAAALGCEAEGMRADGGERTDARDSSDAGTDARPPIDAPPCQWDCLGGYLCADASVYQVFAGYVPCEVWTGSCGMWAVDGVCASGCREGASGYPPDICEDAIPPDGGVPDGD